MRPEAIKSWVSFRMHASVGIGFFTPSIVGVRRELRHHQIDCPAGSP